MRQFSPEQKVYMEAKAAYETVEAIVKEEKKSIPDIGREVTDDEIEKYVEAESAIEEKHDYWKFRSLLREAEKMLLEWGHEQVKRLPQYKGHRANLEYLFEHAPFHLDIEERLINTIMRLQV